jgi:hypothetical protein
LTASAVYGARRAGDMRGRVRVLLGQTLDWGSIIVIQRTDLLVKAEKYRGFARRMTDPTTAELILNFANELEQQAMQPDEEDIRTRAYDLWRQAGEPEDCDVEFWLLAEQELRNENKSSPLRTPDNL